MNDNLVFCFSEGCKDHSAVRVYLGDSNKPIGIIRYQTVSAYKAPPFRGEMQVFGPDCIDRDEETNWFIYETEAVPFSPEGLILVKVVKRLRKSHPEGF